MSRVFHNPKDKSVYKAWCSMRQRCLQPTCRKYPDYGARGITICDRWQTSFENFLEDMGHKPNPLYTIDRIDNDGNYEPGNCRWAKAKQQANNRRTNVWIQHRGIMDTKAGWAARFGLEQQRFNVLFKNHTIEDIELNYSNRTTKVTLV